MTRKSLILLAASSLVLAAPAWAQDQTLTSDSISNAGAISGSTSGAGAASDQTQGQGQQQGIVADIGTLVSTSESDAQANSGSVSAADAYSDQEQGQAQSSTQTNQQGQMATNQQGVSVENNFLTTPLRRTYIGTNTAVALAASSSFSSDYCGGTASAGVSAAPIGVTIGGAKPVFDESCQYLRRAEKFGMAGANYWNMQQPETALKLMSMMVWSICMADTRNEAPTPTEQACAQMYLLGAGNTPPEPPVAYIAPPPPQPQVTPEYVAPNADVSPDQNWDDQPRVPRGEINAEPSSPELSMNEDREAAVFAVGP